MSRLFLKENAEGWKCLTAKEMKDLEKEEKIMRMKLKENKRRKFWKAGNTKLTAMDEENLRMEIVKMKEMTEVEQNIWKEENNGVDKRGGKVRKGNIPEGWWRRVTDQECKEVEKMSQEKRSNNLLVETHWTRLRKSREQIENREEWKCSTWFERPCQEHLRKLEWARSKCSMKAGKVGNGGQESSENLGNNSTARARKF